jgi:phage/plasmid-like protein (TIGR03299 family)
MSHELEIVNGQAQMAYTGDVPWHGLGVRVGSDLTPQEMMQAAGLDWSVERFPMTTQVGDRIVNVPGKQALVRSSDNKVLDVVGDQWIPVQNEDAFQFFDDYVKAGGMSMHTAGSLKDGKIIWGLAKVNESFSLFGGKDEVESYLLLSNPHNYGRGVDVRFTPTRVVCNNTLSMALDGKASLGISLNHRQEFDVEKVKVALDIASKQMSVYAEAAEFMGSKRYTQDRLVEYFSRVFPKTTGKNKGLSFEDLMSEMRSGKNVLSRNASAALEAVDTQPGANLGAGTWWSAYNAVTYMTNHTLGSSQDTRLQSAWFGHNRNTNIEALGLAVEYAEAA